MNRQQQNRLAQATSPYLQQHADNPVDWWPWCPEALQAARQQNKPILLSIGYSACHWCHVMAHESFEDAGTAALMNELFINIKVDREERPDLDKIYQNAHYLLTQQSGGWPLTIFLTPEEQLPIYSGTYFPPLARHRLPAFSDVLRAVAQAWKEQGPALVEQGHNLRQALERFARTTPASGASLHPAPVNQGIQALLGSFDHRHGGFGHAPKFPHPDNLALLLHAHSAPDAAREAASFTLEKMALGGINDQLGGGFCRYSVDDYWMIPHFEKMLYDNASLLPIYAEAWRQSRDELFKHTAEQTAAWVMREMQSPEGGYYSSLDADSEGEEGRYYVWDKAEIQAQLTAEEYPLVALLYGLDAGPNFEGRWHLHAHTRQETLARSLGQPLEQVRRLLANARQKLWQARELRVRPGLDDKILTAWNALMAAGMLRAGRLMEQPGWIESGQRALDFIKSRLWLDGRLLAVHKDGRSHQTAYLDDHAYLILALLERLESEWRTQDYEWALQIAEVLLEHFEDRENGGFYFTADDHERLLQRPKSYTDDAMPSGNGIAAQVFLRLAHLSGEMRYQQAAQRTLKSAWSNLQQAPAAHASLLLALDQWHHPPDQVLIWANEDTRLWRQVVELRAQDHHQHAFFLPDDPALPLSLQRPGGKQQSCAQICQGSQCLPLIHTPKALLPT